MTKTQQQILINCMRTIGLLAHEKDLSRPTRDLLRASYIRLQKVLRELDIFEPLDKDGFTNYDGVEHQYPTDNRDQWESQK